ncbi:Nn.00g101640.m01.CDS01 [Neocucurbitaria sp. VM-36]
MGSLPEPSDKEISSFEPIAIIGMGCRFPGDSECPSELWEFLRAKKHAYSDFPADRINKDSFYHPKVDRPGSFVTEGGCFLKADVRQFDSSFFNINPMEVMSMDPAQRKFLEVAYEAFESAGVPMSQLAGSKTGSFVGNFNYDHQLMHYRDAEYPTPYAVTGGGITILSNRINYVFDLKGPSMTLDTACSSSLYALHWACAAIHAGDCDAAIVGGSNLILTPECQIFSSSLHSVSPTSRCHTFDESADGYARADGVAAIYIKRLSDAIKDRDPIRAVIRGTAINANGRTGGITHPSPDGQEAVIRRAYERAGITDLSLTGYFECHGTGTAVGDPLEVTALGRVFAPWRSTERPLLIGSMKSNLGHSEPTSGLAGVIKAVMSIEHDEIVPSIGIKTLNPNINLHGGRIKIVTETLPWPTKALRRASVNSFGYGGANAHVILDSADDLLPGYRSRTQANVKPVPNFDYGLRNLNGINGHHHLDDEYFLLPFSAHSLEALRGNIHTLANLEPRCKVADLAYTLSSRRSMLSNRAYTVANQSGLMYAIREDTSGFIKRDKDLGSRIAMVFTGQGSQWPQMGLSLMKTYPVFEASILRLDAHIASLKDGRTWTIHEILQERSEISRINEAEYSQPLVTAIQIALVDLLSTWGIVPKAVAGHSSGEIAASYAAGLSSDRSAIIAAYLRGKVVAQNRKVGAMLAVGLSSTEAKQYLTKYADSVTIACYNSPESLTLSGDAEAIEALHKQIGAQKFARLLITGGNAYHSHHMRTIGNTYESLMAQAAMADWTDPSGFKFTNKTLEPRRAALFSSVYGVRIERSTLGPEYWRKNLESPVLFDQAVTQLIAEVHPSIMIEVGPHGALRGPIRQILQKSELNGPTVDYLSSMSRAGNNVVDALRLAGDLFCRGAPVDLARVNGKGTTSPLKAGYGKTLVDLPHYGWIYNNQPLLYENRYTREWRLRSHPRHDILGSRVPGGVRQRPLWRNVLRSKDVPWLADHKVGTETVFPSTAYLSMAIEAAIQYLEVDGKSLDQIESLQFEDVALHNALVLSEADNGVETLFSLRRAALNSTTASDTKFEFHLTSVTRFDGKDEFMEHCQGFLRARMIEQGSQSQDFDQSGLQNASQSEKFSKQVSSSRWYKQFARCGLLYGPIFQGLQDIRTSGSGHLTEARISLQPTKDGGESRYIIHPAALDAALQLSIVASHSGSTKMLQRTFMPVSFNSLRIYLQSCTGPKTSARAIARAHLKGVRGLSADVALLNAQQQTMLDAQNVFLIASDQNLQNPIKENSPYTRLSWRPEFSSLSQQAVNSMFPAVRLDESAVIPSLNRLALYQLIHFRMSYPKIFATGSPVIFMNTPHVIFGRSNILQEPHLQRLLDWIEEKLDLLDLNQDSPSRAIKGLTMTQREDEISRLSEHLCTVSSEARLMCQMYTNLPAIYRGEKTGIQVAVQDNLLVENYEHGQVYLEGNRRLAKIVGLLAHQNPRLRVLEVGAGTGSATKEVLAALHGNSPWRQYTEYRFTDTTPSFLADAESKFERFKGLTFGTFDMEVSASDQGYEADWDLVVASNVIHATSDITATLKNIRSVLRPGGHMILLELTQSQLSAGLVLGTFSDFWKGGLDPNIPRLDGPFLSKDMWRRVIPKCGFRELDFFLDDYAGDNVSATVVCATAVDRDTSKTNPGDSQSTLAIICHDSTLPFARRLAAHMSKSSLTATAITLKDFGHENHPRVISLLEIQEPFFLQASSNDWEMAKSCILSAESVLWVTSGNLLMGEKCEFSLVSGISRGLKTEMSHIRFGVLDLDFVPSESDKDVHELLQRTEERIWNLANTLGDTEFRFSNGIVHISRLVPDEPLNERSRTIAHDKDYTEDRSLAELRSTPFKISIGTPGVLSSIYFEEDASYADQLAEDAIEVEVQSAAINNKDLAVLTGRHHSDSFSDECAGVVTRVGTSVISFKPGDRVYGQSFSKFGNYVRDKAIFFRGMSSEETFSEAVTMPIAFCTAIHGLINLGQLCTSQTVLIQSASGAVGIAACQVARYCGAEIYATVGTIEKKHELLRLNLGISPDHILFSRDASTPSLLMQLTKGKGIDVILSSSRGELMHDYWNCIASAGRFIEIGRTEILDKGHLSLAPFNRNAAFASFDLEVLSKDQPEIVGRLMDTLDNLKRKNVIQHLPHTTMHISEIDKAFMSFSKATHIGKFVITYNHESEKCIKFRPSKFLTRFDPNGTYLLVGCLGGLGRSFSRWAVTRGARHLTFLSRGGASNEEAQGFIQELRSREIDIQVVKGDVESWEDVSNAVAACNVPVKGVINAALTLNDGLFETMSHEQFLSTVLPRVKGTMNLHRALESSDLDFFVMFSSWTTMFGTATQSNYLASSAFMDAFARYRASKNMPATSLGLSQILGIGIVSYMPEYQQAMIRNGFYGNEEHEFLQYCDASISGTHRKINNDYIHIDVSNAHLLVGIEPAGLKGLETEFPIEDMVWASDPRFTRLVQATHNLTAVNRGTQKHCETENLSVAEQIRLRISRLLYVAAEDVSLDTPINAYGIDSMIAAELRNWIFSTFGKDIPLLNLLSNSTTVLSLEEFLTYRLTSLDLYF